MDTEVFAHGSNQRLGISIALMALSVSLAAAIPCTASKVRMLYTGPERSTSELGVLSCPLPPLTITEVDGRDLQGDGCHGKRHQIHLLPGEHQLKALFDVGTRPSSIVQFRVEAGRRYKLKIVDTHGGPVTGILEEWRMAVIDKESEQKVGEAVFGTESEPGVDCVRRRPTLLDLQSPSGLSSICTGQKQPTLRIENLVSKVQYILLGPAGLNQKWFEFLGATGTFRFLGTVEVGGEATFEVPEGGFVLIAADSRDPSDNPASHIVAFESGRSYSWEVFSR